MVTPETLTDEQIIAYVKENDTASLTTAWFATSDEPESERKRKCRQEICDAINARSTP